MYKITIIMILKDISNKLNINIKINLNMDTALFKLSEQFNFNSNAFVGISGDNWFLKIFMPKTKNIDNIKPLFPLFNVEERLNYYILTEKINNNITNFIKKLDSITGININELRLNRNNIEVSLMTIENKKYEISNIIENEILKFHLINNIKMTNRTLIEILNERNSVEPLYTIIFSVDLKMFNSNNKIVKLLANREILIQLKDNYPENDSFRVFIYTKEKLNEDDIDIISIENNIYETYIKSRFISAISSKANNMYIFRDYTFLNIVKEKIVVTTIMPEFRAMEYLRLVYSVAMEFKREIELEMFDKYTDNIFN